MSVLGFRFDKGFVKRKKFCFTQNALGAAMPSAITRKRLDG